MSRFELVKGDNEEVYMIDTYFHSRWNFYGTDMVRICKNLNSLNDENNKQFEEIKELKQELANELDDHEKFTKKSAKEIQKLKSQLEEQKNINKKLNLENQKLFEENISQSYDVEKCVKVAKEQIDKTFNAECELSIVKANQNQLAIEELEKVDKVLDDNTDDNGFVDYCNVSRFIAERINELRGEK